MPSECGKEVKDDYSETPSWKKGMTESVRGVQRQQTEFAELGRGGSRISLADYRTSVVHHDNLHPPPLVAAWIFITLLLFLFSSIDAYSWKHFTVHGKS
ncbi:hypothetical protein NL676_003821 [Syzygium grande]|nr:hypothetical protein NL676_003821 [Syzygium grande]